MEFNTKLFRGFLQKLAILKVSIRFSILSIVLTLLIGISTLIIGINYFSLNSVLISSSKWYLFQSSSKVAEQIRNYLQPLNSNILTAYRMFSEKVVEPQTPEFTDFLYSLIVDNEDLVAAYWCDAKGNFYWLNRDGKNFFEERIVRDGGEIKVVKKKLDFKGDVVSTEKFTVTEFEPRLRPWYQQAQARKKLTWVVYQFVPVNGQETQLGVTSAFPVYNQQGVLQGVFGIDMLLRDIANYVRNIQLTENSAIFVVDLLGNLISVRIEQGRLLQPDETPDVSDIGEPGIKKSFDIYQQNRISPFIYEVDNKKYVAAYEKIRDVKSEYPWYVAIVTPIRDIIVPLLRGVLKSAIIVSLVLLFGILLASIFAASLSRPIKKLASDANLICELRLEKIKRLFSHIREIYDMGASFEKMKNALYSFQRYMPIALVRNLMISNKIAAVGGESKNLTLFFTDIQDFTKLSENFEPENLMKYLSEYFQVITKIIIDMGGTVDKYVGDGVVAFWGAPIDDSEHAYHACQAALRAQKGLLQLNLKWRSENKPELITRFGISSGRVVVGNVGSDDRLSYTSLGDPVNLASRLEEINKIYKTQIIVSESTYVEVKDKFKFRLLDRVAVRGKTQGVFIYELLDEVTATPDLELERYNTEFLNAFSSYEYGNWQIALDLFNELDKKYPALPVIKVFINRCTNFIKKPPQVWHGIWTMDDRM